MASVAIRLGTSGKAQVRADLEEIAQSGEAGAKRHARAWLNAANDVDSAMQRQERAIKKLEMVSPGLNPTKLNANLGIRDDVGKSAQASASVFGAAYAQMEARAEALLRAVDPVRDAQARFNATIGEARGLVAAGVMGLDDYVTVLRTEQATLDSVTKAHGRAGASTTATGRAFASASPQIQDFFVQVSMGANPMQALAVQGGQLAGQMIYLEGTAGKVARFLMGPWGIAFQVGMMVLAPFVAKLWEESEADKKAREAKEEHRKAVLALADAQEKAILTAERKQALDTASIKNDLDAAIALRIRTQAALEAARAELMAQRGAPTLSTNGMAGNPGVAAAAERVDELTAALKDNAEKIEKLQRGFDSGFARMIGQRVDALSTPEGRAQADYARRRAAAEQELSGPANAGRLTARLRELNAERDRELERIQKSTKVMRDGETLTANQVKKMLMGALPGVHVTSTTGGKHVKNSYHYRNQAVDFVPSGGMSSMTKADVRRIFESRGIEIVELLGPGDKGHSDHFHVAWTKGKLALDEFTDAAKRAQAERKAFADGERDTYQMLERFIGNMAGPDISGFDPSAVVQRIDAAREAERAKDDYASGIIVDQRDRIALSERELQLVGANDNYREAELGKLRIILDLQRQGIDLESDRGREILSNAEKLDEMAARLRRQQAAWDEIRNTGEGAVDRLFDPRSAETWGERVKGVLGDIKAELFKLMLLNPIKNWLNGGDAPTLSGVLGKLSGGSKGIAPGDGSVMNPDWFKTMPRIPGLATGSEYTSGGAALVGEFGPEIVSMPRGSRVTPANDTRRLMAGEAPRGGNTYNITGNLLTPEFWAQVQAGDDAAATRGAAGGSALGQAAGTARSRRRLGRRW